MVELVSSGLNNLVPMQRSEGRHVSAAIRRLCIQLGHFEDTPFPEDQTRMEMGSAFEDMLALQLGQREAESASLRGEAERWHKIGEQCVDDIYGTPDFIDLIDTIGREIKLTWLSIKHDPEGKKFFKYWLQCKAYGYMLGINTWYLHIGHIMGNYQYDDLTPCPWCVKFKMPPQYCNGNGPHYHVWRRTFTDSELHDAWALIKAYV